MTINHIGLSGGKDSTALWLWAIHESGYPKETLLGSFADTQNEYPEIYRQVEILNEHGQKHGVAPIRTLRSEGFLELAKRKQRFPSAKARFCTQELKIFPMLRLIEELWLDGFEVVQHSGVRASESTERARMDEWAESYFCRLRRPLLQWSISDVWKIHQRYRVPINPIYFTGRKRVGCKLCCMSNKQDVRITAKTHPETIDQYRAWEKELGTIKSDGIPSSFFPADKVPEHLRSIKGLIRKRDGNKGKAGTQYSANTIDDVVRWSTTLRGGKQIAMDFMFDDAPEFELDDAHAPCQSGYCE